MYITTYYYPLSVFCSLVFLPSFVPIPVLPSSVPCVGATCMFFSALFLVCSRRPFFAFLYDISSAIGNLFLLARVCLGLGSATPYNFCRGRRFVYPPCLYSRFSLLQLGHDCVIPLACGRDSRLSFKVIVPLLIPFKIS